MIETPPRAAFEPASPVASATQGLQVRNSPKGLFAYYVLVFIFLVITRELVIELNSRFDLTAFPKLAEGVDQALDDAAEFDTVLHTIYSLLYAFLFSLPVAIVYRVTKDEERFDPALGQTIVLLAMVVTAVMLVIGESLPRGFALAGVVAAVRFRNTLDDAKDAVYVFLAIAIGMACGARAYSIAVWTSLIMTSTLYLMRRYHFGQLPGRMLTLREGSKKAGLPPLSAEAHDRIERMLEQQHRLAHLAALSREPGEKKSNAGLVIEAREISTAQRHVEGVLASSGGRWRLANVIARESGAGTLEFVGRLAKAEEPSALVQALLAGSTAAFISTVEFRSLKGPKLTDMPEDMTNLAASAQAPDPK